MIGDRPYVPGDIRNLDDISAALLLASGAIEPTNETKVDPVLANKVAPKAKTKGARS